MKCENCGFELTDTAKFCPECGTKVERKPQFNLGEKNVIAGDVYGSKEDIHISGNATFIEDGDETKKAATCSNCGRHVLLLNGYTCRECGKFVCSGCYSKAFKVCLDCAKKIEKAESKARTIMLNLESFIKNQAANYESEEDFSSDAKDFLKKELSEQDDKAPAEEEPAIIKPASAEPNKEDFELIPLAKEEKFNVKVFTAENAKIVLRNIENRMILVEGGRMYLGSIDEEMRNPLHLADVKDFYISQIPVTQKLFKFFMGTAVTDRTPSVIGDNFPIHSGLSYIDAFAFCNIVSSLAGLEPVYSVRGKTVPYDWEGYSFPNSEVVPETYENFRVSINESANGYRLPYADEYEFASRGGIKTRGFKYPGSDDINEVAWYLTNSDECIHKVALKKPNELGLYDMLGNIPELCNYRIVKGISGGTYIQLDGNRFDFAYQNHDFNMHDRYWNLGFRLSRNGGHE